MLNIFCLGSNSISSADYFGDNKSNASNRGMYALWRDYLK